MGTPLEEVRLMGVMFPVDGPTEDVHQRIQQGILLLMHSPKSLV